MLPALGIKMKKKGVESLIWNNCLCTSKAGIETLPFQLLYIRYTIERQNQLFQWVSCSFWTEIIIPCSCNPLIIPDFIDMCRADLSILKSRLIYSPLTEKLSNPCPVSLPFSVPLIILLHYNWMIRSVCNSQDLGRTDSSRGIRTLCDSSNKDPLRSFSIRNYKNYLNLKLNLSAFY